MGNNQACCGENTIFDLNNNAEIYIREQLLKRSKEIKNYQDIKKISQEIFGVFILDIEEDPLEWITKDLYYKFIKQIFNTKTSDEKLYAVILNYNDINLSVTSYKDKFNLLILIWLLGFAPEGKGRVRLQSRYHRKRGGRSSGIRLSRRAGKVCSARTADTHAQARYQHLQPLTGSPRYGDDHRSGARLYPSADRTQAKTVRHEAAAEKAAGGKVRGQSFHRIHLRQLRSGSGSRRL